MLLLLCRTLPEDQTLPPDQRWRTVELAPAEFEGLDLSTPQGIVAAIKRICDGSVPNVEPLPPGSEVYLTDTEAIDCWSLNLSVTKD